jgi:hypothetical protein
MKYEVFMHWELEIFEKLITEQLAAGWTLVGGVTVTREHGTDTYYQAMVLVNK